MCRDDGQVESHLSLPSPPQSELALDEPLLYTPHLHTDILIKPPPTHSSLNENHAECDLIDRLID